MEIARIQEELSKTSTEFGNYKCLYYECNDGFNDIGELNKYLVDSNQTRLAFKFKVLL